MFCLFDLSFVISYSNYFGFPTLPPLFSLLPWQLLPVQIQSLLSGWRRGLNLGSTTRGQNKKSEKLLIPKRGIYQGQTLQQASHWPCFCSLLAATESTNLSTHPVLKQSLLLVLTREARQPSQTPTTSLQDSGNISLSLPLTRSVPSTNSQHQSFQKPPSEQPEGPDVQNNPSGCYPRGSGLALKKGRFRLGMRKKFLLWE